MANLERRILEGSEVHRPRGVEVLGPLADDERVEFTLVFKPRAQLGALAPQPRSRREVADLRATADGALEAAARLAAGYGLEVLVTDTRSRRLVLAGSAARVSSLLGVGLVRCQWAERRYRSYEGAIALPAELAPHLLAVLGLDARPFARSHLRRATAPTSPTTAPVVAEAYDFPAGTDGSGTTIGFVELGGGWEERDLVAYCDGLGLTPPSVRVVGVDGARNSPTGDPSSPDTEVMLDLEVATGAANGARLVLYMGPNTDAGFYAAIAAAVRDVEHDPVALSISWGAPESTYPAMTLAAFESVLEEAAHVGMAVFAAAGDQGASDGLDDGLAHVDYPAASPWVTACGGTRLELTGTSIASETVWNDLASGGGATGGGISRRFDVPAYQSTITLPPNIDPGAGPGRGVPDVAANADPDTGYAIVVDGLHTVVGGTSAAAPLWAALLARCIQAGAPRGFLNPKLYAAPQAETFHEITQGSNGAYVAGPGWNACCGLGSPRGSKVLAALTPQASSQTRR
jgi:kumamolisin